MAAFDEKAKALLEAINDKERPPLIMGILNVTPDSFYDGGRYSTFEAALERAREMVALGAQILDIGGESTRPCAKPVPVEEERRRVIPLIKELAGSLPIPISVDTRRASIAEEALSLGAVMVNDVSAFRYDPEMPKILGTYKPIAVAMHMRGTPEDMMAHCHYNDVVKDVIRELEEAITGALQAGLPKEHVVVDPGIGFAKTWRQCLEILNRLEEFTNTGYPVCIGVSRKSFIGQVLGLPEPSKRLFGTAGAVAVAVMKGARIIRVHDPKEMGEVVRLVHAIMKSGPNRGFGRVQ